MRLWAAALALTPLAGIFLSSETENAAANGDTRTLTFYHVHTRETTTVSFRVNGVYDSAALEKLNWALRDWRRDEPAKMDPRLFDVVWEVYQDVGATQPIWIMSAYRSPETNAMLRRRSRAVAEFSQHMLGKAMDVHLPDMSMAKVRDVAMRLQRGGVGYYPTSGTPFVHIDVGSVRYWPRISREEMVRIFPDGKTVDIPADGQPMPRYNEALAEIQARGGSAYSASVVTSPGKGLFAWLFGGGEDDEAPSAAAPGKTNGRGALASAGRASPAASSGAPAGQARGAPFAWATAEKTPGQPTTSVVAAAQPAEQPNAEATSVPQKPQVVAANESDRRSDASAPDAALMKPLAPDVPMPPRRPADLFIASAESVPMPPARPIDIGTLMANAGAGAPNLQGAPRSAAANSGAAAANPAANVPLPSVITQGTGRAAAQGSLLAFAEVPASPRAIGPTKLNIAAVGPRREANGGKKAAAENRLAFIPARIDRSNFRALIATASIARATAYSALGVGAALAPLRSAVRDDPDAILSVSTVSAVARFSLAAKPGADTGRFAGSAVRALAAADDFDVVPVPTNLE